MGESGTKYLGDVLFDKLTTDPKFIGTARKLVAADWRAGADSFREYAKPLLDEIFAAGGFEAWGDLSYRYLEHRVMEGALDLERDPWLWTYDALAGALVDPIVVRTALNGIAARKGV